jgi:osmotically-inducible protein OsmY
MTRFDGRRRSASGRSLAALVAIGLALGAGTSRADDAEVKRRVEERLVRAKVYEAADVRVSVEGGAVTLEGAASRLDAALAAERAAGKESKSVANRIRVVPDVERKDADLRKEVFDRILGYVWYTVYDSVEAGVEDGVVTLRGSVNQPYRKTDIESRVAGIAGLKGLKSEIRVQGASSFDDRLRRELVYRIYGDERFVRYAGWVHPPVRIVVDKGRVTLTGLVGSAVEQQLVGHIARGTLAFGVDNKVKLESDVEAEPVRKAVVEG